MSGFFNHFKRNANEKHLDEESLLSGQGSPVDHRLTHDLEDTLDEVVALFAPTPGVFAEVLLAVPGAPTIVTAEIRPTASAALFMALRAGEGIAGEVFQTGQPFAGNVVPDSSKGALAGDTRARLYSTRSALAVPLRLGERILGVLNVECPQPDALNQDALARLHASGLTARLVNSLEGVPPKAISRQEIVENILDRLQQKLVTAVSNQNMLDTYYQLLQIARMVVQPAHISGALILVRPVVQNTAAHAGRIVNYGIHVAMTGQFTSTLEWDLDATRPDGRRSSITKRILDSGRSEIIPNAQADPDYRSSGDSLDTRRERSSELLVPLIIGAKAIGVFCLVVPHLNAFSESDLRAVEAVARLAVDTVKQSEEIADFRRNSEQSEVSDQLLDTLADLFPADMSQLTMQTIARVRKDVSLLILDAATRKTGSEHGAFLLAEQVEDQQLTPGQPSAYLVMQEHTATTVARNAKTRHTVSEGVSGAAYTTGRTCYLQHVTDGSAFISMFQGAQSDVAAPMKIGDTTLGVLDVESNWPDHYTNDHLQWIEFLALQAAFALTTIDRAVKAHIELTLSKLSRDADSGIAKTQTMPALSQVRAQRYALMYSLIEALTKLTGAWVGRYFAALNAYKNDQTTVDEMRGQLIYLVSTDSSEDQHDEVDPKRRFFGLNAGVSGKAFSERRLIAFNDRKTRDEEYPAFFGVDREYALSRRDSGSGIYIPVFEGPQIVGVLNLEAEREGAFTSELVHACELAGAIVTKIVTATRLRITALLQAKLRTYDAKILAMQTADIDAFMSEALIRAGDLSSIDAGWGRIVLLTQAADMVNPLLVERRNLINYASGEQEVWTNRDPVPVGEASRFQAPPEQVVSPVFLEAMRPETRGPVLILKRDEGNQQEWRDAPWPAEAHCVICVPLLRPRDENGDLEAIGLLALAYPNDAEFSEFDKQMLTSFAETIVSGLKNIALLQARKDLLRRVRHDFSLALKPLTLDTETLRLLFDRIGVAPDANAALAQLGIIRKATRRFDLFVFLLTDLVTWFFDLSNDDLQPEPESDAVTSVADIVRVQQQSIDGLAEVSNGRKIDWQIPAPGQPPYVKGGENRERLIRAALWQYFDNAIKYGESTEGESAEIAVTISQEAGMAVIAVISEGPTEPEAQWEHIFGLYYRGENVADSSSGSGVGLFQAREIAKRLDGKAYYRGNAKRRQNAFYLALPIENAQP